MAAPPPLRKNPLVAAAVAVAAVAAGLGLSVGGAAASDCPSGAWADGECVDDIADRYQQLQVRLAAEQPKVAFSTVAFSTSAVDGDEAEEREQIANDGQPASVVPVPPDDETGCRTAEWSWDYSDWIAWGIGDATPSGAVSMEWTLRRSISHSRGVINLPDTSGSTSTPQTAHNFNPHELARSPRFLVSATVTFTGRDGTETIEFTFSDC